MVFGLLILQVLGYLLVRRMKWHPFKITVTTLSVAAAVWALPEIYIQNMIPSNMPCGNPMLGPMLGFPMLGLPLVSILHFVEEVIFKATPPDPEQSQNLPENPQ
ncbi:MAG: hypothetical protein U0176_14605 [Bacteroidia bacterium]